MKPHHFAALVLASAVTAQVPSPVTTRAKTEHRPPSEQLDPVTTRAARLEVFAARATGGDDGAVSETALESGFGMLSARSERVRQVSEMAKSDLEWSKSAPRDAASIHEGVRRMDRHAKHRAAIEAATVAALGKISEARKRLAELGVKREAVEKVEAAVTELLARDRLSAQRAETEATLARMTARRELARAGADYREADTLAEAVAQVTPKTPPKGS